MLSLLIIIQTQISVAQVSEKSSVVTEQHLKMLKLQSECTRLQKETTELKKHIEILRYTYKDQVSEKSQILLDIKDDFMKAIEKSSQNLKKIQDHLNYLKESLSEVKTASENMEELIQSKENQLSKLRTKIDNTTQNITKNLRLPHRRIDPLRRPQYYLVKGNKVYLYGGRTRLGTSSPYESEDCLVTPLIGSIGIFAIQVEPIKRKGMKVPDDESGLKFLFTLKDCSPERDFIMFFVYGDSESFKSFQRLKNIILDRGFLYGVNAYPSTQNLVLYPGSPSIE